MTVGRRGREDNYWQEGDMRRPLVREGTGGNVCGLDQDSQEGDNGERGECHDG
jgi:hypothetical protein